MGAKQAEDICIKREMLKNYSKQCEEITMGQNVIRNMRSVNVGQGEREKWWPTRQVVMGKLPERLSQSFVSLFVSICRSINWAFISC